MTVDKSLSNSAISPLAAIALKLVGIVTILSSLLDFVILLVPPDFTNQQWLLNLTTNIVDRGIVPLVGIALLLAGYWIERTSGKGQSGNLLIDLRFWACAIASFLGIVYLLTTFLHVNTVRMSTREALAQVEREANQATTQLEERLTAEVNQQQSQLQLLFQQEETLQSAIESGQIPEQVLDFRDDPAALDDFLSQRVGEARQRIETEIGTRREEARGQIREEAIKSALRIATSSILLTIGYVVVGWTGLRRLMSGGKG
ncbi:MAG: HpsJ family protein [Cyanobacteria bacterium P01_H01_bin.58]